MFEVAELCSVSKTGNEQENEDFVIDTPQWLVVCDGATDESGKKFWGRTGGQLTAILTAQTIIQAPNGTSALDLISTINDVYRGAFGGIGQIGGSRPSCSFVALDKYAETIIRVSDVSWSDGHTVHQGWRQIDNVHGRMRAAYLTMLLTAGASQEQLLEDDPGRDLIYPSLQKQGTLCNNVDLVELSYGAIDGTPVPDRLIETWKLGPDVSEVIIATDGYPVIKSTLEHTEAYLQEDLALDPLRIAKHAGTKGLQPDQQSFDDRTYVRVQRTQGHAALDTVGP